MAAAPDYKAMYFALFRASEQAVRLLQQAQLDAEDRFLEADPPPLRLDRPDAPDTPPQRGPEP